jgi:hypothetical protein
MFVGGEKDERKAIREGRNLKVRPAHQEGWSPAQPLSTRFHHRSPDPHTQRDIDKLFRIVCKGRPNRHVIDGRKQPRNQVLYKYERFSPDLHLSHTTLLL